MEHLEIERKWLLDRLPEDIRSYPSRRIVQAYLCTDPVVRVRQDGDAFYLTYKGHGRMVREEYNLPLTEKSFAHLMAKADGTVIRKVRYRVPLGGGLTAEIDAFCDRYEGLLFAEVEFPDEKTARSFQAPDWFGRDVTEDASYSNAALSLGSLP